MRPVLFFIAASFSVAVLAQTPGSLDATFNAADAGLGRGDGFSNPVTCVARQTDGKLVVGGYFPYYYGATASPWTVPCNRIARLNSDGTFDSGFNAGTGFNSDVNALAVQADGKIIVAGSFTTFNGGTANRIVRLTSTGALDPAFLTGSGFDAACRGLAVQSDGKLLVTGSFAGYNGSAVGGIVRLNADGSLDTGFNTGGAGFVGGASAIALQGNAQIVVGGGFTSYNGTSRGHIARLNTNGSLDMGFNPNCDDGVYAIVPQSDGNLLIGGWFTFVGGVQRISVARLLPTGALDATFNPGNAALGGVVGLARTTSGAVVVCGVFVTTSGAAANYLVRLTSTGAVDGTFNQGLGCDALVQQVLLQPDGKLVAVGWFSRFDRRTFNMVARLNTNGSPDTGFATGGGVQYGGQGSFLGVMALARQTDGKVIVGGQFRGYNMYAQPELVRVNTDGTLDNGFDTGVQWPDGPVSALTIQTDGKVLVAGGFTSFNGSPRGGLVRLNSDGSTDPGFSLGTTGFSQGCSAVSVQPDGKIIVGGGMTALNGSPCNRIVRLNSDGSLDPSFNAGTGPNNVVRSVSLQPDGKVILGGAFTQVNGTARGGFARLLANGALDTGFSGGTGISGSFPVVWCTALQPDGRVVIAGEFTQCHGVDRSRIARLNSDGTLDNAFHPAGAGYTIRALQLMPDGRLFIGGMFSSYDNINRSQLARIHANGSLDHAFVVTGTGGQVNALLLQPDGKVIAGGDFMQVNGAARNRLARLNGGDSFVRVSPRVFLEGPYDSGAQLMGDALRMSGLVPTGEPYSGPGYAFLGGGGGESTTSLVLATTGNNAVVDHVVVELREPVTGYTIQLSQDALVQRDGDVVAMDGVSALSFSAVPGSYRIAVRHRNHLGVMTAAAIALTGTATSVDFTLPATATNGTAAQKSSGSRMVLWAGDATGNGELRYTGTGNDRDTILIAVGSTTPNATVTNVYDRRDTNLDGVIKYTGSANDRDIILTNVGSTTPNNTRTQQLP